MTEFGKWWITDEGQKAWIEVAEQSKTAGLRLAFDAGLAASQREVQRLKDELSTASLIENERDCYLRDRGAIYARCVAITSADNTLSEMTRAMVNEIGNLCR